ncbi:MAG: hypothetical protein GC182_13375 [Rhodopseudomonas sp.]|nr:hypothetical protein [Rhodopseudomonas sp.]
MKPQLERWIKHYGGPAAGGLLALAFISGVLASNYAYPLIFLAAAGGLAAYRYREDLKTFDFWALEEWARTRYDALGVPEWHSPHQAAELYCSQVVVRTRNEAATEMNTIMMELIKGQELNAGALSDMSMTDFNAQQNFESLRGERNARYDAAQIRYNQCNASLSRELQTYLARGHLLAKGMPMRDNTPLAERVIPTARWRVMTLDIAKGQAFGYGWQYGGLVVGIKPKPQKRTPPPPASAPRNPNNVPGARVPRPPRQGQQARPRPPRPSA